VTIQPRKVRSTGTEEGGSRKENQEEIERGEKRLVTSADATVLGKGKIERQGKDLTTGEHWRGRGGEPYGGQRALSLVKRGGSTKTKKQRKETIQAET